MILAAAIVPIGTYLDVPRQADALSYHLPMAAQWVQTQSIFAHDSRLWYYPGGYESVNAVLLLLTGSDALWFVPDLLAWVLLALATYSLLQQIGVEKPSAAVVLATLAVTPVVTRTLGMGDNDLWLAALAVTATDALLRSLATDSREARAAGIVCLGALVSTKYSAPPWLLLAFAYFVVRRTTPVPALKPVEIAAMVLGAVLLISFPLRNQILTGNPIYPTGLGSLIPWGDTSMLVRSVPAITPEELASSALIGQPLATWEMFLAKIIGYMPMLPLLLAGVVTIGLARPHAVAFERKDALLLTACLLALAILLFQPLVVENIPGTRNQLGSGRAMRFALTSYVLFVVFLIARVPRRIVFHAALGLLAVSMFWHGTYQWMSVVFAIAVALFLGRTFVTGPVRAVALLLIPLTLASISVVVHAKRPEQTSRAYRYGDRTRVVEWLQSLRCPQVIVASTSLRAWPLIGHDARNRVVSVGMSLPAEEYLKHAALNRASVVLVSGSDEDQASPMLEGVPPGTELLLPLLGANWMVGYRDGFVLGLTNSTRTAECPADRDR